MDTELYKKNKKLKIMKKVLGFIAVLGLFLAVACNNPSNTSGQSSADSTAVVDTLSVDSTGTVVADSVAVK